MNIPRAEYPRPQLVREKWLCLNGQWDFEIDQADSGRERGLWDAPYSKKINVPFAPESKLSGVEFVDFMRAVWYRRTFKVPADWNGGRVLLHFGAVDYRCEVRVNGKSVGTHRGGYTPFVFDITDVAAPGEDATVVVYCYDDTKSPLQPTGKQAQGYANSGCVYTRTTGIWQTVWLEYVPKTYVRMLKLTPDVDNACLHIRFELNESAQGRTAHADVSFAGEHVSSAEAVVTGKYAEFDVAVPDAKLWGPGEPNLYDLDLTVGDDTVRAYFGMRKVTINGYAIEINDKPVYQRLVLDQGFYPDGIYTAPTDEDLRRDVELSMDVGFNGARLHMKIFEPRLIYWADKLGYLLWGEYPNWGLDESDPAALLAMLPEWLAEIERDYNSPAIVGWCPFNETGDRRRADTFITVYDATRAIDPMRPIIDSSGYHHAKTDIYDVHNYEQDPARFREHFATVAAGTGKFWTNSERQLQYDGKQPYFVSEYGGTFWDIDAKGEAGWGYGKAPEDMEELYRRLEGLTDVLLENPRMCAYCYTQLTDVFQEKNGIYAFDRRPKFDAARLRAIFGKKAAIEK